MTVSALDPRVCGILYLPFKSGVCFPQPSGSPENKSCWPSKSNILGACLSGAGPPGYGTQCRAQTTLSLGRNFAILIILPFVGYLPVVWVLTESWLHPLLPISLRFLLYIYFFQLRQLPSGVFSFRASQVP